MEICWQRLKLQSKNGRLSFFSVDTLYIRTGGNKTRFRARRNWCVEIVVVAAADAVVAVADVFDADSVVIGDQPSLSWYEPAREPETPEVK